MNPKQIDLAAFAELIGITPETRWWLFHGYGEYDDRGNGSDEGVVFHGPALDSPEADGVYMHAFWLWLNQHGYDAIMHPNRMSVWGVEEPGWHFASLLRAALAAGVPEIVALFKENPDA